QRSREVNEGGSADSARGVSDATAAGPGFAWVAGWVRVALDGRLAAAAQGAGRCESAAGDPRAGLANRGGRYRRSGSYRGPARRERLRPPRRGPVAGEVRPRGPGGG